MRIDDVNRGIHKFRKRKRIGRGTASGQGKTAGRGQDGQKSRRGSSRHPALVGEDLPMIRRIPKRGFTNRFAATVVSINVCDLAARFDANDEVTPQILKERGIIKRRFDEIKILGNGEIDKPLKVTTHRISESARQKITAAGGTVTVVPAKQTPQQRVAQRRAKQD
ncbi:MAG: 50S ribosomal protein L15 [Planctomycetota bacterium]|nr:MAG: 50S ribosomal protein L15 [Planctomycetota bacterium]